MLMCAGCDEFKVPYNPPAKHKPVFDREAIEYDSGVMAEQFTMSDGEPYPRVMIDAHLAANDLKYSVERYFVGKDGHWHFIFKRAYTKPYKEGGDK